MDGLTTGTLQGKLGIRAGNTGTLFIDGVRVPVEHRIGEEGEGFIVAMSAIDQGRFTVAIGRRRPGGGCLDASSGTPTNGARSARRSAGTSWSSS